MIHDLPLNKIWPVEKLKLKKKKFRLERSSKGLLPSETQLKNQ